MRYTVINQVRYSTTPRHGEILTVGDSMEQYTFEADNVEKVDRNDNSFFTIKFKRGKVTVALFPSGNWTTVVPADAKITINGKGWPEE